MNGRARTGILILAAFVLAVVGWELAGWIVSAVGLDELDLPARVGGVFLALSLGEAASARFFAPKH